MSKTLIWYLQLTRICNHKCVYCSNPNNWNLINLEETKKFVEEMKKMWYTDIIMTWWEPTMHPKILDIIDIIKSFWINPRLITNWHNLADFQYLRNLMAHWLYLVHLSVYTHKKTLNDFIRWVEWAYKNMIKTILNLKKFKTPTQVTIVISSFNQDHLCETTKFIRNLNNKITHFVFNVLDPLMMIKSDIAIKSIPDLNSVKDEIKKTFNFLESEKCTFRIERIPLCKIPWFEWANTEARKLAKKESRITVFLDERWTYDKQSEDFRHDYIKTCEKCDLYSICWWVYELDKYFKNTTLEPIKKWKKYLDDLINKILW